MSDAEMTIDTATEITVEAVVETVSDAEIETAAPVEFTEAEITAQIRLMEAVIFASAEPVTMSLLQQQLGANADVPALLEQLKDIYAPRGVNLVEIDGHWGFRTAADIAPSLKITRHPRRKLPRAAAEVLAIIAYNQPVSRADIESIRGVETSKGTLDILLELGWVRPGKRRDTPGRPLTWHTTSDFLSHFNITSLDDLPGLEELKAAGLLDVRPVMSNLPREGDGEGAANEPSDDDEFASWVSEDAGASEAVAV